MSELYEVKTEEYNYYVEACSFDEAKFKVEEFIAEECENSIIDEDGSLRQSEIDQIKSITCLTTKLIK